MTNGNETMKKLLFISDQICEIYETMYNLSMTNQEKSNKYESTIEFFENYISQENTLLDNSSKNDLISILKNLYEYSNEDSALNRCYETVRYYFLNKYPEDKEIVEKIEGIESTEVVFVYEDDDDSEEIIDEEYDEDNIDGEDEEKAGYLEIAYEDEENIASFVNYVTLRTKINVIKKIYHHIKNTQTDNKTDSKYKKELLKQLKGFKCDFFFQNRDTEQLGIKCHFDVNKLPTLPKLDENIASICFNECIDILDELYLMPSEEREVYAVLETLFSMLCFDEYIKELSPEQINKLIEVCYQIEANISKSFFGNIGLQKLKKLKKN